MLRLGFIFLHFGQAIGHFYGNMAINEPQRTRDQVSAI